MSKELAGELFCRVDIDYRLYKKLKEEHEMTLLKIYDKEHRKLYKDNKEWCEINETFKEFFIYLHLNKNIGVIFNLRFSGIQKDRLFPIVAAEIAINHPK